MCARRARRSAEAEDELRVVGHPVRRPRRIPRELDVHVLDPGKLTSHPVDVLLDQWPDGTPHRREAVRHLHLRPLHLHVVEQPEVDDVHPELGILDLAEGLDDLVARRHGGQSSAGAVRAYAAAWRYAQKRASWASGERPSFTTTNRASPSSTSSPRAGGTPSRSSSS